MHIDHKTRQFELWSHPVSNCSQIWNSYECFNQWNCVYFWIFMNYSMQNHLIFHAQLWQCRKCKVFAQTKRKIALCTMHASSCSHRHKMFPNRNSWLLYPNNVVLKLWRFRQWLFTLDFTDNSKILSAKNCECMCVNRKNLLFSSKTTVNSHCRRFPCLNLKLKIHFHNHSVYFVFSVVHILFYWMLM